MVFLPLQVLVISNPDDAHTKQVAREIQLLGGEPILFYPEQLGSSHYLTLEHVPQTTSSTEIFQLTNGFRIDWDRVYSIWYRRPRLIAFSENQLSSEGLDFARDEWRTALAGLYALLKDRLWVSHPDHLETASRKPLQLKLAAQIGLVTPKTLITNDPYRARAFFETCMGQVIVKATGRGWVYAQNTPDLYFVMTNQIQEHDLKADEEIRVAPVTFQEAVPKLYELRVNIVGQQVLTIKIDSQKSSVSALDWRRYDVEKTPYLPYQLPVEVEKKCLELTRLLGLEFGAIDLIRRPDGEYVFLEINGNGQFLWAEELSGVRISHALASLFVGAIPTLKSAINLL